MSIRATNVWMVCQWPGLKWTGLHVFRYGFNPTQRWGFEVYLLGREWEWRF